MAARGAPRAGACAGGGGPGRVAPAGPRRAAARRGSVAVGRLVAGPRPLRRRRGHGARRRAGPAAALAGPLAEWWNGRRWRRLTPVIPPGAQAAWLADASCPARPGCVAVGEYTDQSGIGRPLAERLSGGRWRLLPVPAGPPGALDAVWCGAGRCVAVGDRQVAPGRWAPLALAGAGRRWQVRAMPAPAHDGALFTQDVACAPRGACLAVGWYEGRAGAVPFAARLAGGRWRLAAQPSQAPAGTVLDGVARPSRCVAVGSAGRAGRYRPAGLLWSGGRWRVLDAPGPANRAESVLGQVSCPRPDRCLAVGQVGAAGRARVLAMWWDGSAWRTVAGPAR